VSARSRLGGNEATGEQRVALVAAVLALPVASVAIAQLLGPSAPQISGVSACSGVPVAGSRLQARTGQSGLNARSGPGTTYALEGRFDIGCTVGVDGYCVGESVQDLVVPLPDVRWLRLRHSHRYVASGTLISLGPETSLGSEPERSCPERQLDPNLAAPPSISRLGPNMLVIKTRPIRSKLVGFGLCYERSAPAQVERLGITPKLVDGTGHVLANCR